LEAWIIIIVTLFFSALFSGAEIAFLTSNKLRIEVGKKRGGSAAQILAGFSQNPAKLLSTILLGNNIALVMYSMTSAPIIAEYIDPAHRLSEMPLLLIQTLLSTFVILILAEFLPKTIFRINPDKTMLWLAMPLYIIYVIILPLVALFNHLSRFILKVALGIDMSEKEYAFGPVDLDHFIHGLSHEKTEEDLDQEIKMFKNVIDFRGSRLRDCMVHRAEIVAVDILQSIEELTQIFVATGHSKIPVYSGNIDNITGYIHSWDLFAQPKSIGKIVRPLDYAPETALASEAFQKLIKNHRSILVVIDEFGGTSGIVTLEDLLEEIIGEIDDEYDSRKLLEKKIGPKEYLFDARHTVEYINQTYKLELPESDNYNTLAGMILEQLENIPGQDETVEYNNFTISIHKANAKRIMEVKINLTN
jgi:CBS domain containing-hemolysin-like protein